ncbi:MAG: beta-propeller domain-containing protein, partial [Acholeplasmataceae bacterium]
MKKILLFIITLTVTFTLIGCDARFENPTSQTTLSQVKDLEEFKTLVESTNYNRMYYDDVAVPETAMDGNVSEDATTEKDASETNVQVAGVDEGDIIKTDGNRIYRVNYNSLIAVEVNGAEMSIVLDETLESSNDNSAYTYYLDLYLTDRYLVVIGQRYDYVLYTPEGGVIDGDD